MATKFTGAEHCCCFRLDNAITDGSSVDAMADSRALPGTNSQRLPNQVSLNAYPLVTAIFNCFLFQSV